MILKPQIEHEIIEFFLLSLKWAAIMVLAVVISKSHENWGAWEISGEHFLDFHMGVFEQLVLLLDVLARVLSNFVGYEVTVEENVIYAIGILEME